MELVGVADIVTDWRIQSVAGRLPLFASTDQAQEAMIKAGLPVAGSLEDLLQQVDVIADTTPKRVAADNLPRYRQAGVKVVLQGGESHETTGHSFVAQANYESALGRDLTRVVSCNTTSIVRVLGALQNANLLAKARGVLIRRATDPWESHLGGIMNTMVPEQKIPSHQGPDAQTVPAFNRRVGPGIPPLKLRALAVCPPTCTVPRATSSRTFSKPLALRSSGG